MQAWINTGKSYIIDLLELNGRQPICPVCRKKVLLKNPNLIAASQKHPCGTLLTMYYGDRVC